MYRPYRARFHNSATFGNQSGALGRRFFVACHCFRLRSTLSRPSGSDVNVSCTRIELIGANTPLGATLQPIPFGGMWFDPAKPGQGVTLLPVPGEDRLVGTWNTYADGKPMWYLIDTGDNGFDGLRAIFDVYRSSGGALREVAPFVRTVFPVS